MMALDWNEIKKVVSPLKEYEDLYKRLSASFSYPFVLKTFNFPLPKMMEYTRSLLGGDPQARYTEYVTLLTRVFSELQKAGVGNIYALVKLVETRQSLDTFCAEKGISGRDIVIGCKFLIFWFVPAEKYMSGLIGKDPLFRSAIQALSGLGVRFNLDLLQRGFTHSERKSLAAATDLPEKTIEELVNRADFSRMPWASKATISNIMGAGYATLDQLASADPQKLYADFYRYGESIGKNLKFGNEIENSYRIAKIVPKILQF